MRKLNLIFLALLLYLPAQNASGQVTALTHVNLTQEVKSVGTPFHVPSVVYDSPGDSLKALCVWRVNTGAAVDFVHTKTTPMNGPAYSGLVFVPSGAVNHPIILFDVHIVPDPMAFFYSFCFEVTKTSKTAFNDIKCGFFNLPPEEEEF